MLKFKVTNGNKGVDVKTLDITDMELQDFTTYDVTDGYYDVVTELNDEVTYKFWVKDLFTIQEDSHLTSISNIPITTEYGGEAKQYKYVADVVVTSVSKADNCLTLNVKKEIELDTANIYIETRYNAIMFVDNRWEMFKVTQEWLTEQAKEKVFIRTDKSPYGENRRGALTDENTTIPNNTVFYYENDSWKEIDLVGEDWEHCLNGNTINFGPIHDYDKLSRGAIRMEEDKIYYTRENYIILDFYPSHYFGMPDIQYDKEEMDGVMEMIKYTDDGKEVINSIDYPVVYFYFEKIDDNTGMPQMVKLKKEVHVEDEKRLVFNFDKTSTDEDMSLLEGKMFPYGYEINPITNDISFQEGMLGGFVVKRDNMMFDERYCSYTLTYDFAVNTVKIPISQKFENDLFHNDMIQKNFVDKAVANSINPIIDMEKDVYTPAIQKEVGEQVNAKYDDCYKIIFNLHFLEHRDTMRNGQKEKWVCDKNSYWNGTRVLEKEYVVDNDEADEKYKKEMKKVVDLKGRVYNYDIKYADISKVDKYDYFSYYGVKPEELKEPLTREYDGFDNPNKEESNDYKIESDKYKELRDKRVKLTEYQSDLLSYLGFTNDDVKYQKSKLKKSFLRISFYDSDNIANQNLLHTATIFLDSGDLFAKYIKNIETEDEYKTTETVTAQENPKISFPKDSILTSSEYKKLDDVNRKKCVVNGELLAVVGGSSTDEDKYTVYDKAGMAINREPMRKRALKDSDFGDNIDELERLRMSSQIVVTDKNSSKRSSEGFYFYTYKTNDNGVYPSDIYMRVEFNHAGYGRVIPFMMPYIRKSEETLKDNNSPGYERYTDADSEHYKTKNKIKTFDDICYDWSEIDIDRKNNPLKDDSDIGYSAVRYMKYCHIKWKYRYDKQTQKHIYYLDPDVYGTGVTSENNHGNNIILNLYEGKIR